MLLRPLLIAALLLPACRGPAGMIPRAEPSEPVPVAELWVGGDRPDGVGSRARPFSTLEQALARVSGAGHSRVHLGPGRYEGPFELPAGLELVGAGEGTVLEVEGEEPVVRAPEGATLRRLSVRGGTWGLEGAGPVRLEAVRLAGQSAGAVRLEAGHLALVGAELEAGGAQAVGVWLGAGTRAEVRDASFLGPYQRGVEAREAEVELESVRFHGPATALFLVESRGQVRSAEVEGGDNAGLFAQGGSLRLESVRVTGHEYALQVLRSRLVARGLTSVRARRAGVALVGAEGRLEDVVVLGSGSYGGLHLVGSDTELRGVRVDGADSYGISASRGRLRLRDAVITRLTTRERDSGDGLHLRDVKADVEGLVVRDVAGVGVLSAQGSEVVLRDVALEDCREAGVLVETLGRLTAVGLEVRGSGGPALVATWQGLLEVDSLTASGNAGGLLWTDCGEGAQVRLGRVRGEGGPAALAAPCVEAWARPSP